MIHVSAPMEAIVSKYVWIKAERWGMTSSSESVWLANLR